MKILVTGNMGYVGPCVVDHLRATFPDSILIGCDQGFFAGCLTVSDARFPETSLDKQYFTDVRNISNDMLREVDSIVHLAAISNDPMGEKYESQTLEINYEASIALARKAKQAGVKSFVFASSCSVYGFSEEGARTEKSEVTPLTAYARSKVYVEHDLLSLADDNFCVSCLRFATACGMSPRLRLDLVLNDFVAGAVSTGEITILSDGSPRRPLIDVHDMALAIEWATQRETAQGGAFLVVNVGRNVANYQVRELAETVKKVISGVQISINSDALPDKRSYKVDFSLFEELAPNHQPRYDLERSISDIYDGLSRMNFSDRSFRNSKLIRLIKLESLLKEGQISDNFYWIKNT